MLLLLLFLWRVLAICEVVAGVEVVEVVRSHVD